MLEQVNALAKENVVSIRELQKNPSQALKNVTRILRNGKTFGFFFSQEEFKDLLEDLQALSSPRYLKDIVKADEQIKQGQTTSFDDLKKEYDL